ncbi:DUF2764 family protein [Maribellus mangrovi]|uniref:DUF2764 family protein n=1 Tax=Maribellus mangrovi TaxID=3133146 RepID=UPI0030EBC51D
MLKGEYYCLVAGLPDLVFGQNSAPVKSRIFLEELRQQLHSSDYKLIEYLFLPFDNLNLLNILLKQNKPYFYPGIYSKQEIESQLSPDNEEMRLPQYMFIFMNQIKNSDPKPEDMEAENGLSILFYEHALNCSNTFLQQWFRFEINLKNVITAFNCKLYNYNLGEQLLKVNGANAVYTLLIENKLKPNYFEELLPYYDEVLKIADSELERLEKEKAIDKLKWLYLDEHTFFHFFTIEKILAYTIKLLLIERWMKLDKDTGKELLNKLIEEFTKNYEFPEEFNLIK